MLLWTTFSSFSSYFLEKGLDLHNQHHLRNSKAQDPSDSLLTQQCVEQHISPLHLSLNTGLSSASL